MRNEVTDLLLETLSKYGLKGTISDRTKHLEVSWEGIAGPRFIIAPKTPSDWRSGLNCRSQLRGMLRKDNQPLLEDRPTSFQKAMSLPQESVVTIAARERALQKDVETLCELILEMQDQLNTLSNQMRDVTVVSTVMSTVKFAGQPQIEEKPEITPVEVKPLVHRELVSSNEVVINCMSFSWKGISEITKESKLKYPVVNQCLMRLKKRGLVENGQRGMWRRKPDGSNSFQ